MKSLRTAAAIATAVASIVLAGCGPPPEPLVLWSNVADAAFFVELYNQDAEQPVQFRYVSNLTEMLTQQRVDADIVIGRWVNNPPTNAVMVRTEGQPPWQPLAFNLGTIVFDTRRTSLLPEFAVTLDEIGQNLRSTDADPDEAPKPMRFVPSSNPALLYEMIRLAGVTPGVQPEGGPRWNPTDHDAAFATVRRWQEEWNTSPREEQKYRERYLYEPWYRQLETGRVLAVYLPSNELLDWSFFDSDTLDFRWIQNEEGIIPVLEDVVYGGIPEASSQRVRARRFLDWVTNPDTQIQLMRYKIEHRIDTFGVFGGFSTVPETNRRMTREIYTDLIGRAPRTDNLRFPGERPRYWDEALAAVVEPFLAEEAGFRNGAAEPAGGTQLLARLQRWYDQRGD
jgi:hypothetical protein